MLSVTGLPFISLSHPKCPSPGVDFIRQANCIEDNDSDVVWAGSKAKVNHIGSQLEELYRRALYDPSFVLSLALKNTYTTVNCLPGHIFHRVNVSGPRPADVMLVGKMPTIFDLKDNRHFSGNLGKELRLALLSYGIPPSMYGEWYATTVIKHSHADPTTKTVPVHWYRNWAPVLFQELCLVRPKVVVCFGSEAANAVIGKKIAVKDAVNIVYKVTVPECDGQPEYEAKVLVVTSPGAVLMAPEQRPFFMSGIKFLRKVLEFPDKEFTSIKSRTTHKVVYYEDELAKIVDEIKASGETRPIIVFDSEWDQQHYLKPKSYVRTIQFSAKAYEGVCVVLRDKGGAPIFQPSIQSAANQLKRLVKPENDYKPRIAGHHLRADLPWIMNKIDHELGQILLDGYAPSASHDDMRHEGGLDTMMIAHSIRETGFHEAFKLEYVCQALLGSPLWNRELDKWIKDYCKEMKIKKKELEGYGEAPDAVLHPYACDDVAYPRALIDLAIKPGGLLDSDEYGNSSWEAFHTSMKSAHAFLEMEMTGMYVDMSRAAQLTQLYQAGAAKLLSDIREETKWPDFNPASSFDTKELLYGPELAGRKSESKRPEGSTPLYLEPIKTSTKPQRDWNKLNDDDKKIFSPSTDKETLGILSSMYPEHKVIENLRRYRFLSQVLKGTLRPPTEYEVDDGDSETVYEEGLLSYVQNNQRIYTSLFPTQETGRTSSVRPNLMNVSKRRERDYSTCLGDAYKFPLRSIFTATPVDYDGIPTVLVEFDLRGAELKVMAIQSGDPTMIDHTERANLPESSPDYIDIHSNTAVKAFKLNCPPTKEGLASIGKKGLRDVAKTFAFGLAYGRGDDAIVRGCKEEGVTTNKEEVEELRKYFFDTYPLVGIYISQCQDRAVDPGWISNCFGRIRRFGKSSDREIQAKLKREAGNFPIQSTVADLVHNWMHLLFHYENRQDEKGYRYKMLLQVHDAILVECRVDCLDWFTQTVIPTTLSSIPIYRCDLDGNFVDKNKPYYMGTDISLYRHWGIELLEEDALELGVPLSYVKTKKK